MIKKFFIIVILFLSCSKQNAEISTFNSDDSIKLAIVKKLIADFKEVNDIKLKDSVLIAENEKLKEKILAIMDYALNGKELELKSL